MNILVELAGEVTYWFKFYCVKKVSIWSYSGPYFPAFRLNTERYSVSIRIQSEFGKIRTRITLNTDTFYAVLLPREKEH